jgi:ribosome-binding protein aMBF1 (putative translation factor)
MDHQDWKPVILSKKKKPEKIVEKVRKTNNSNQNINLKKLEADDVKLEYIDKSISKKISEARLHLKMSQQDLANRLCVKKNIVNDLESGKVLKNDQIIKKALKLLNIK